MVNAKLLDAVPEVGIILIAGDIRSGKSCLAYGLAEDLHARYPHRPAHVFGFPGAKAHLLPEWISSIEDPEFPDDSIVIADEAYRRFYSRESWADPNKFADQFSGLVGQKGILAIYLTQTSRKLEVALVSGAQVFLLKKPSRLMVLLDRSPLRTILAHAFDAFQSSSVPAIRSTYVVADAFEGLLEHSNTLPTFWSEDLSRVWRGVAMREPAREPVGLESIYRRLNSLSFDCWDDDLVLRQQLNEAIAVMEAGGPLRAVKEKLREALRVGSPWHARVAEVLGDLESSDPQGVDFPRGMSVD